MSQGNPSDQQPYPPVQQYPSPANSGRSTGVIIAIVAAVVAIPMLLMCVGILVALLLPAVQASREAARRMSCVNNMKQIALAMHNYHSTYNSFPPAYTTDAEGQPLHSWRTLLLPYMDQQALYAQIDLSKPWDDPVNLPYNSIVIPIYACPSGQVDSPEKTCYQVIVDPSSIFNGPAACTMNSITDGTSNTLLVTETASESAVPWMAPQDTDLPAFLAGQANRGNHIGGANAALADGAVKFLSSSLDLQTATSLVSKNGGELLGPNY
jgi:type II secretory pathway pseudopilin PulG